MFLLHYDFQQSQLQHRLGAQGMRIQGQPGMQVMMPQVSYILFFFSLIFLFYF